MEQLVATSARNEALSTALAAAREEASSALSTPPFLSPSPSLSLSFFLAPFLPLPPFLLLSGETNHL